MNLIAAVLAVSLSASGVGAVDRTVRVLPTVDWSSAIGSTISLRGARNEFVGFQLIFNGGASGLTNIDVSHVTLEADEPSFNGTIPTQNVRFFREAYYVTQAPRTAESLPAGRIPDALIPKVDDVFEETRSAFYDFTAGLPNVPANENRVVYVEIFIPPNVEAGPWTGRLTVTYGGATRTIAYYLTIDDFTLPTTSSLRSLFSLAGDDTTLCDAYYGLNSAAATTCEQGLDGYASQAALRVSVGQLLLEHRVSGALIKNPTAVGSTDWTRFDSLYAPYINGQKGIRLVGARPTTVQYSFGNRSSDQATEIQKHQAWWQHFVANGWSQLTVDYICDEPGGPHCNFSDIPSLALPARSTSPSFKTLVTTDLARAQGAGVDLSNIDVLSPVVEHMHDRPDAPPSDLGYARNTRPDYNPFLTKANAEVWWYQSCDVHGCSGPTSDQFHTGWPSRMIDAPSGIQLQAMEWLSWLYQVHGELYYEVDEDFRTAFTTQTFLGGYGDGTLIYPGLPQTVNGVYAIGGTHPIVLPSYRLKMIRDGMQAYEYMERLYQLTGSVSSAANIVAPLFSPTGGTSDYVTYKSKPSNILDPTPYRNALASLSNAITSNLASTFGTGLAFLDQTGAPVSTITAYWSGVVPGLKLRPTVSGSEPRTFWLSATSGSGQDPASTSTIRALSGTSVPVWTGTASCAFAHSYVVQGSASDHIALLTRQIPLTVNVPSAFNVVASPSSRTISAGQRTSFCVATANNGSGYTWGPIPPTWSVTGAVGSDSYSFTSGGTCGSNAATFTITTDANFGGTRTLRFRATASNPCAYAEGTAGLTTRTIVCGPCGCSAVVKGEALPSICM